LTATGSIPCKPAQVAAEPAYKDPDVCLAERVEDLLARMTLAEKIGQMTQAEREEVIETDIGDKFIGAMLSGGGSTPVLNTPEAWVELVNRYQEYALQTRLGIPLMYGIDAVHGHNAVVGAVVFPHNVGLGATRDPDLVERIGRVTAEEMAATGIHWNFAPVVAVPQDIRWGRIYEGYSENTELVSTLAAAYIRGLQNIDGRPNLGHPLTVLATPKHFVGDGGTRWGSSTSHDYQIDQGITDVDEATLRAIHLPPYLAALDTGVKVIMASYSSWGGMKMHAQKYLLTGVLKEELGFTGFLLSDWEAIEQIPGDYYHDTVTAVNAGVDMNMAPSNYNLFIKSLTQAVQRGDVPMERIDEAVRRILAVKFELGLFERPLADKALAATVGSAKHRAVGREAVRKSLVLLKNDNQTLPLAKETPLILVAGRAADDIGIQCGGWTIEWQGKVGEITTGTTILEAIQNTVSAETTVEYDPAGLFEPATSNGQPPRADVGIVVVGETPYAEGEGDKADLALSPQDIAAIERVKQRSQKLVVILISGRPMIITDQLSQADAFVAAWLPGTEGQGVADVLFGVYPFTGKLPYTWPRSMDQLPLNSNMNSTTEPLFPFGYGLEF
jgi:beta-glucosidase